MATQRSYVLVNKELLSQFVGELASPTGKMVTRTNQRPIMEDVQDEDGKVVGEQRVGWELYEEEVEELAGGYVLIGRTADETYSAIMLMSPNAEQLRAIGNQFPAAYIELYTEDVGGEGSLDSAFQESKSLISAMAYLAKTYGVEDRVTPVGKLNQVVRFPSIGGNTVKGTSNREIVEGVFSQLKPGWKVGDDNIG